MAKNSIRDYDATSGNNTDVQSVDISEGCAASGINNALREIMTDLKNVSTGAVALETPAADQLNVDNIRIDGNTISSTDTNGDITLDPDGTGDVIVTSAETSSTANLTVQNTNASGQGAVLRVKAANTNANSKMVFDDGGTESGLVFDGGANAVQHFVNGTNRMTIDSSGNVGIGRSPVAKLDAYLGSGVGGLAVGVSGASTTILDSDLIQLRSGSGAERLRVDSNGHTLFGQSSTDSPGVGNTTAGAAIRGTGISFFSASGSAPGRFNRSGDDGKIIDFLQDGSTQGYISTPFDTSLGIFGPGSNGAGWVFQSNNRIIPAVNGGRIDDGVDIGNSTFRLDNIFATNTSIQTSDQNEKQDIAGLTSAEITAAKAISKLFKTYKWKSKVAAKGDAARTHTGVIAQEVQTAMTDAGLDASKYAFWCSDTWWETSTEVAAVEADEEAGIEARDAYTRVDTYDTADEAPEGATQRTRLGIRYAELLAFVGAATEQRLGDIETRLTALENA